ncbi:MAG: acyl phosphate:glycerol-3-phosphate acyltransferase [Acidobacteriota bacterium]|jgi:glycerol-3-phosphate acyltransferase PlsY|nr:acyl phosphate:glycerol-3-phosphate acyltransferase [Acidobacteriota bacterium]MDT5261678.1 acyl phosphate:glycerol-3-phosphate acyltransferase [Acidobacteriota bacterium]
MLHVSVVILAYLLGSIPFGYLLVRLGGGGDVRETGSGGTGATNVTRRAGRWAGLLTLLLDALKGTAAVLVARVLLKGEADAQWWVAAAAVAAVLGHVFPVWLRFRGGKGVATGLGVFLVLAPLALLCALFAFVLIVWVSRYVSLGSITAAAILPLAVWSLGAQERSDSVVAPALFVAAVGGALIIFMHRANIERLLHGKENKLK